MVTFVFMSISLNIPLEKAPFNPLQYITLVLGGSATLNQPFFVASYEDYQGNTLVGDITNTGTANNTTPVPLVPTPKVNISRKLTFISITNQDTAQATITISMNTVTGTGGQEQNQTITIYQCTLQPNYTLVYNEEDNFRIFDQNGVLQQGNSSTVGSFYQQAESLGINLTQRPAFNAFSGLLMRDNPSWMRTDIYLADSGVNPGIYGGSGYVPVLTINGQGQITQASQVSIGGGTVTNFSAGNLPPLFTTSVSNPSTSPTLSFNLTSQSQNLFYCSPNGSSGVPTFRAIVAADLATSVNNAALTTNGSSNLVWLGYSSTNAASTLVYRDTNGNTYANSFSSGFVSSGATNPVLTVSTPKQISFTAANDVTLPDATTLQSGAAWELINKGISYLPVKNHGGVVVMNLPVFGGAKLICHDNSTANGLWYWETYLPDAAADEVLVSDVNGTQLFLQTLPLAVQANITELGTITTGVWNGTAISNIYGGTGIDSHASTGVAQVNAGVWSVSTALANGTTATTQTAGDNSTKVATTAYMDGQMNLGAWQTWSPSYTGFSANPPTTYARYMLIGKMCFVALVTGNGTSNSTSFTVSMPFTPKESFLCTSSYGVFAGGINNGAAQGAYVIWTAGTATFTITSNGNATGWTASGNKGVNLMCFFEIQ